MKGYGKRGDRNGSHVRVLGATVEDAFLFLLIVGWGVGIPLLYVSTFYLGRGSFETAWLFFANDPPAPFSPPAVPLLGTHFFGDFQHFWIAAAFENPYAPPDGNLPSTYLPLGLWMTLRWLIASPLLAYLIVMGISVAAVMLCLWAALSGKRIIPRATVVVATVLLCGPMILALDRGNLTLPVTALVLTSFLAYFRGHRRLSPVLLGIASAVKILPLVFMLVYLRQRDYRAIVIAGASFMATGVLALGLFPGGLVGNARRYVEILSAYSDFEIPGGSRSLLRAVEILVGCETCVTQDGIGPGAYRGYILAIVLGGVVTIAVLLLRDHLTIGETALMASAVVLIGIPVVLGYLELMLLIPLFFIFASRRAATGPEWIIMAAIAAAFAPLGVDLLNNGARADQVATPIALLLATLAVLGAGVRRYLGGRPPVGPRT